MSGEANRGDENSRESQIVARRQIEALIGKKYFVMHWFMPFNESHGWALRSEQTCCLEYVFVAKGYWLGFHNYEDAVTEKLRHHSRGAVLIEALKGGLRDILDQVFLSAIASAEASEISNHAEAQLDKMLAKRGITDPE